MDSWPVQRLAEPRKTQYPRHFDERSASDQHFPLRSPRRGIEIAMTLPIQQPLRPNLRCCPQRLEWVASIGWFQTGRTSACCTLGLMPLSLCSE